MSTEIDPRIVREVAEAAFRSDTSGSPAERVEAALIASGVAGPVMGKKFDAYSMAVGAEYNRLAAAQENESHASWDPFADIADITAWLDESNPAGPHEDSMRVMKLMEEAGEAGAAYIGMVGQNPRKGVTHTMDDLLKELADVAITALCAMQHFTQDEAVTRAYMAAKIQAIIKRSDISVRAGS